MEFIFNKIILGSIKTVSKQYLNIDICIINSKFGLPLSQTREKKRKKKKRKRKGSAGFSVSKRSQRKDR